MCNMVECNYSEKLKNFDGFDQRIKPTYKGPWIRLLVGYEFVIWMVWIWWKSLKSNIKLPLFVEKIMSMRPYISYTNKED